MRALWLFAAATLVVGRDRDEAPVLTPREQILDTAPSLDAYATNATLDAPSYSRDADGLHRVLVAEDDALSSVTTGFGLLNEPDAGIDYWRMLNYNEDVCTRVE